MTDAQYRNIMRLLMLLAKGIGYILALKGTLYDAYLAELNKLNLEDTQ